MAEILTVGHSVHEADQFLRVLHGHGVELLVDVRRYPASRRVPHFNAGVLAQTLASGGIGYEHAEELGGRRPPVPDSPNGGWTNEQFRGYADHMASDEFAAALDRLESRAAERRTAVMCAEAPWWRCHRRLLADALVVKGHDLLHLDGRGGAVAHKLTDFALVEDGRLTYPPAQESLEV